MTLDNADRLVHMNLRFAGMCVLLAAGAAAGRQGLFLTAESARVAQGAPIRVRLEQDGKAVAWDDSKVRLLFVLGTDRRENMEHAPGAADAAGLVSLASPPAGSAAVGLELRPIVEEMDAAALRKLAEKWGDEELAESVKGKGRVRHVQSCRTLVRVGDGSNAAAVAEIPQAGSIDARVDPTRAKVGTDVMFAVASGGQDLEDVKVVATCVVTGKAQEAQTREEGLVKFTMTDAGRWRVEFHRLEKAAAGDDVDWVLTSGTLTFEVPAEGKP